MCGYEIYHHKVKIIDFLYKYTKYIYIHNNNKGTAVVVLIDVVEMWKLGLIVCFCPSG